MQEQERAVMRLVQRAGLGDLSEMKVLDVGCGGGGQLLRWIGWGVPPAHCAGIDLLADRVESARQRLPAGVEIRQGDATHLPFADGSFDIVTQFTVFSSILDSRMKRAVAAEMLRVLRPAGLIVWYDFWLNPTNPQTRGIRPPEIRALFPGCRFDFQRITLAPPLARRLAPVSWLLCEVLSRLKLFNSHYLVGIRKASVVRGP
jgi:SAM-dependent methyltransferase